VLVDDLAHHTLVEARAPLMRSRRSNSTLAIS
jgi:hypothetical protein